MATLFITGGAGFIGSNFIHYWLQNYPQDQVICYDALTYCGNLENLKDLKDHASFSFIKGDIGENELLDKVLEGVDILVNFAAESHNDRAVLDPGIFVKTNVLGTQTLLEAARRKKIKRFHHISTCEVFGDLALDEERAFKETDAYRPLTPYNASKAAADHVVRAYYHTFLVPITISHCANNYGPYQFPEKVIPLFTTNALEDKPLPLFKSSQFRREWIHVDDHSRALDMILKEGQIGETYNIGTGVEKSVEEIADAIIQTLHKPLSLKTYVPDRLQHDRRYLLDTHKIRTQLRWSPQIDFDTGIKQTIEWYIKHRNWWEHIKSGAYQNYYTHYYQEQIGRI